MRDWWEPHGGVGNNRPRNTVLATALAEGEIYGSVMTDAQAVGTLDNGTDPSEGLLAQALADVDLSLTDNVRPRLDRHQIVAPFEIYVDSVLIPPHKILPGAYIEEDENAGTTFGFSVPLYGEGYGGQTYFLEPLGDPLAWYGPPANYAQVDIYLTYVTETGKKRIQVVNNGTIESSRVSMDPRRGYVREFHGLGQLGRYDLTKTDITHPAGHGMTKAELAQSILEQVGMPNVEIVADNVDTPQYFKEIQLTDVNGLSVADDVLRSSLYHVHAGRDGTIRARRIGLEEERDYDFTFTSEDLLSLDESETSDGPTRLIMKGERQITHDAYPKETIIETGEIEEWIENLYEPWKINDTSGNLVATGLDHTDYFDVVYRDIRTIEKEGTNVVSERLEIFENYNPSGRAATQTNDAGARDITYIVGRFVNGNFTYASVGSRATFRKVFDLLVEYEFDDEGYLSKIIRTWDTYYNRRIHIATLDSSRTITAWSTASIFFNLEGVTSDQESFRTYEVETHEYERTEDGYLMSERIISQTYDVPFGDTYFYQDGRTTDLSSGETFDVVGEQLITYRAIDDTSAEVVVNTYDGTGKRLQTTRAKIEGYLPAADKKEQLWPGDTYDNAVYAARSQTQTYEVTLESEALKGIRQDREELVNNEWVETTENAEEYMSHLLREASSIPVTIVLPMNALVRSWHRIKVEMEEIGKVYDVWVGRVRTEQTHKGITTTVTGRQYVI
jgi:hypothetical protein